MLAKKVYHKMVHPTMKVTCKHVKNFWKFKFVLQTKITHAVYTQIQPFWMQWSWHWSLLVPIRDVNLKLTHWQVERWSSGSRRIVVRMSANIIKRSPCQQGIGEGYRGQNRPWQEEQSVLYIHGSLGCTKLFCTLPCAQSLRMTLLCACVGNFSVKKFRCLSAFI